MSGEPRRPRSDAIRNRTRIIEAARAVFAEQGLAAPLDMVARRSGLGSATLYRYFPVREALVLEAFRVGLRRHDDAITRAQGAASGWAGFQGYLRWLFREQLHDRGLMEALTTVLRGTDAEVDTLRRHSLDGLEAMIDRAKEEGAFRQDRWLEDVLLLLLANEGLATRGGAGAAAASDRLLEVTLASLSTERAPEPTEMPASARATRAALRHRLDGLPLGPDDL